MLLQQSDDVAAGDKRPSEALFRAALPGPALCLLSAEQKFTRGSPCFALLLRWQQSADLLRIDKLAALK